MAVNDIVEITFRCQQDQQAGVNVRHYRVEAETTGGATLQEIATAYQPLFAALYQELLSSRAQFRGVSAQKVHPAPRGLRFDSPQNAVNGLRTGDALPKQTSGIITLRTNLAGRRFRGRAYIPFPAEVSNDNSAIPTGNYIEALGALADEYRDTQIIVGATGSTTLNPVIFRRMAGTAEQVRSTVVRLVWATQRRRGDYGRPNPVV